MPYVISAILSLPIGFFVEKYGYRMALTFTGSIVMLLCHAITPTISSYPECDKCWYSVLPLMFLGISYTTYAIVLWGAIPFMVDAKSLGTAFGICGCF